jgi:hypothetical protein
VSRNRTSIYNTQSSKYSSFIFIACSRCQKVIQIKGCRYSGYSTLQCSASCDGQFTKKNLLVSSVPTERRLILWFRDQCGELIPSEGPILRYSTAGWRTRRWKQIQFSKSWTKSTNHVILSVICHRQNPFDSTEELCCKSIDFIFNFKYQEMLVEILCNIFRVADFKYAVHIDAQ